MTWYLDPDTGDVYDESETVVTTVEGPPFTLPEDIRSYLIDKAVNNAKEGNTQKAIIQVTEALEADFEFGVPPSQR